MNYLFNYEAQARQVHTRRLGPTLVSAMEELNLELKPYMVQDILMTLEGRHREHNWHWVFELHDNRLVYMEAGSAYSGFDCGGSADINYGNNLSELFDVMVPEIRNTFKDMFRNGETVRANPLGW